MAMMRYGLVPYVDKPVSRILYGTARIEIILGGSSALRLLDEVLATGTSAFDTAREYDDAEQTLGRWIQSRRNRDSIVILSKCAHPTPSGRKRVDVASIRFDLDASRKSLQTDRIDIYLLHRDDEAREVGPIVEMMNELHHMGTIGAFGGSNWSHHRIKAANDYAQANNLVPFTVSSPHFGLADLIVDPWGGALTISGRAHKEARDWYCSSQMPVVAWSSLGRGFFSGRVRSYDPEGAQTILDIPAHKAFAHPDNFERLRRAEKLAVAKGCTVPQLALAWIFNQSLNAYAVVSASNGARMAQNINALDIKLTTEEVAHLDLASSTGFEADVDGHGRTRR